MVVDPFVEDLMPGDDVCFEEVFVVEWKLGVKVSYGTCPEVFTVQIMRERVIYMDGSTVRYFGRSEGPLFC